MTVLLDDVFTSVACASKARGPEWKTFSRDTLLRVSDVRRRFGFDERLEGLFHPEKVTKIMEFSSKIYD